jgi:hypothetical protein
LDTGTTIILIPQDDAVAIHEKIPGAKPDGQGGFTVPCDTNSRLALTFGKQPFEIDSKDLAFRPLDPNNATGDCTSGIGASQIPGAPPTQWLVRVL